MPAGKSYGEMAMMIGGTPERFEDCPWKEVTAETMEVLAYHSDWERGIHPVSTGRAPWLPSPFIQAMHFAGSVISKCGAERIEEAKHGRH